MVIAVRPSEAQMALIASSTIIHVTDKSNIASIVIDRTPSSVSQIGENCTVHLKAGQGWSIAPMKLLRDYSVLDLDLANLKDWGRYLYFFVGEPSRWAILKNLSSLKRWEDVCGTFGVIRIPGAALLSYSGQPIFYRSDDDAIALRGDFRGPALVTPSP